ncbi:MAG: hypothetical protein AB8G11_00620 [Saprospiraceae bacterium]
MKKILLSLVSTLMIFSSVLADPWEDLTEEQAQHVIEHLTQHPFILDYCDCCDTDEVYLMKVLSTRIEVCSYNEEKVSIIAKVIKIGKLEVTDGTPSAYRTEVVEDAEIEDFIITMNYTFTYSECGQWAVPLFKEVAYDRNHVCKGATRFPSPFDNEKTLQDAQYIEWFVQNIGE